MHEDDAYDDEELYTEDGDFLPDIWQEEGEEYEYTDSADDSDDDYDDETDAEERRRCSEGLSIEEIMEELDWVQDDEGNWGYRGDFD